MIPGLSIQQDTGHLCGVVGQLAEDPGDVGVFHLVGPSMPSPKEQGGSEAGGVVATSSHSHQVWGELVWEVHGSGQRGERQVFYKDMHFPYNYYDTNLTLCSMARHNYIYFIIAVCASI